MNIAPRIGVTVKGFEVKEKRSIYYGSFKILFHIHSISGILLVKQSSHLSKAHRYVNKPAWYCEMKSKGVYRMPWKALYLSRAKEVHSVLSKHSGWVGTLWGQMEKENARPEEQHVQIHTGVKDHGDFYLEAGHLWGSSRFGFLIWATECRIWLKWLFSILLMLLYY